MEVSGGNSLDNIYRKEHNLHALVDQLAKPHIENGTETGIVIAILDEQGQTHTFGYGKKSLDSDVPPDGDTIFATGSLTKSVTGLLFYDLIKDGTLRYEDTVGDILPEEKDFSPAAKGITLGQLANHSSGLPRQPVDLKMLVSLTNYSFTGENIYRHMDKQEIYHYLQTYNPSPKDIGEYVYSNMGFALLGQLIEAKTKKSLDVLMQERFFTPLGMNDTSYVISKEKLPRLAQGHVGDSPYFVKRNTPIPTWDTHESVRGMAGIYSTSNDLLKFVKYRMSLGNIPVVKEPIAKGFFGNDEDKYENVSFGWSIDKFNDGKTKIIYRHGLFAGYSSYMGFEPKTGIAVIALYNTFNWNDSIGHNLLLTLSRNSNKQLPLTTDMTNNLVDSRATLPKTLFSQPQVLHRDQRL